MHAFHLRAHGCISFLRARQPRVHGQQRGCHGAHICRRAAAARRRRRRSKFIEKRVPRGFAFLLGERLLQPDLEHLVW